MKPHESQLDLTNNLVERFIELSIKQYRAEIVDDTSRWNILYKELNRITLLLKERSGDQRNALMSLYGHKNMQVHVNAAIATLAVAPEQARAELRAIAAWPHCAQRVQADEMLEALAGGHYLPS